MVVFCCNVCGESLKKNQVEKHWQTVCRGNRHVSCMDCQKDFAGSEYQAHTKCISEEQKYSAPGFVAKVNKGEVKQDLWIQQVHAAIKKSLNNPRLKDLLQRLLDFPNIPRKKQKFENFLSNSMRVRDKNLVSQVWDVLMSEKVEKKEEETQAKPADAAVESNGDGTKPKDAEDPEVEVKEEEAAEKKLSKRERKEARRNKQNKVEKKEKKAAAQALQDEASDNEEEHQRKKKKKNKKRKRDEEADGEEVEGANTDNGEAQDVSEKKKKKKKKHKEMAEENGVASEEGNPTVDSEKVCNGDAGKAGKKKKKKDHSAENGSNSEETPMETSVADVSANGGEDNEDGKDDDEDAPQDSTSKLHHKVRVDDLIVKILQSKGDLPVKKLKKKVLQELTAQGAMSKSREAVWAKVEKKLNKNPRYKLHKDRVSLLH